MTRIIELTGTVCERIVAAYFWVGKRGVASPTPDEAGMAVPDQTESNRYVATVYCRYVLCLCHFCQSWHDI